ncbi:hypothetical protein [Sunxiuqinia dokdonensis]|uniref:Uncharacterized protein n=1 Tax=Sunxiuqinia dokdonensis TaxID=1409788 RepID=A0A0L8V9Y0_9BACT|nr:hypothetical protein [Sunxiuqinia dokdonensis]KOH45280.1 hypothetical protein NC99_18880 [Sunxiuqinia dokdonensis]
MINNDLIQIVFSEEEKTSLKDAMKTIQDIIKPKAPNLSTDERREYGSVAELNKLKIDKGRTYMAEYPAFVPAFVDAEEFERDYQARLHIGETLIGITDLQRQLSDIKILLDYDNYQDVLAFYRSVRYHAMEQDSSAITIYNDMKKLFPYGK